MSATNRQRLAKGTSERDEMDGTVDWTGRNGVLFSSLVY